MTRRKIEDRNIRKLSRHKRGTMFVSLPKELVSELGWRGKQKVMVKRVGKKLIIKDWKE